MKNTFLTTLIAIFFALSLTSCDKDDEPKRVFYIDSLVNALPFNIELNVDQQIFYLRPSEKMECYKLVTMVNGVPMLNADFAYKGGAYQNKDSMIVVKDYPFIPIKKAFESDDCIDSVNYYTFTEEVFRDIIAKMKAKGIAPTKYDYEYFSHIGKVFGYFIYKNTSSYDIRITDPISATIKSGENVSIRKDDGMRLHNSKNSQCVMPLDCTLYFADKETSYSLEVSGFEWEVSDYQSFTEGLNTTDTFYFVFTDELLESIKSFMAEKNVFPQETEFPKE